MPDRETWSFINTFAPWLSALGSLSAALVALYLARRSGRGKVQLDVRIVGLLRPGTLTPPEQGRPSYLQIRAVNSGFRDVLLPGVVYWDAFGRSEGWIVLPPRNDVSTGTPARLQPGDYAVLLYPREQIPRTAATLLGWLASRRFPRLAILRLRVRLYSSIGERFSTRLDKRMRRWLLEQVETFRAAEKKADP